MGGFLSSLLAAASAETPVAVRQAYRKYIIRLTEFAYIGYEILEKREKPRLWQRFSQRRRHWESLLDSKQIVLELYWRLQIVQAREEGKLPAWEGIRIAREQVPLSER